MAGQYAKGLDANGQWEAEMRDAALARSGAIADLGQIPPWMKRKLDASAKAGALVKYRGHWNTLLAFAGLGPLKTIWALPAIAEAAGAKAVSA